MIPLIFIILLSAGNCLAQDQSKQELLNQAKDLYNSSTRSKEIKANCFDSINAQTTCEIEINERYIGLESPEAYDKHFLGFNLYYTGYEEISQAKDIIGSMMLSHVAKKIKKKVRKEKLNACQKTCLIKCVTSNILEYDDEQLHWLRNKPEGVASQYRSPGCAIYDGKGVCIEFSEIFYQLNGLVGDYGGHVSVKSIASKKHAYNQVLINEVLYTLEPQRSACTFYRQEPAAVAAGKGINDRGRLQQAIQRHQQQMRSRPSTKLPYRPSSTSIK